MADPILRRSSDKGNWQQNYSSIRGRLNYLLFNGMLSDITFIVGSQNEHIPAHKFVLSMGSNVFHAMFYGVSATRSEFIEIPDVEASAFRNLLRYLYSDEVNITGETVTTTLYAAKKYSVPGLEERCVAFLQEGLAQLGI